MLIRVILDTCVVRNHVHVSEPMLNVAAIRASSDQLRMSLSASAFAELLEQLCRTDGGVSFEQWSMAAEELNSLLDNRWPFFPNGAQLSALTGVQTDLAINIGFEQRYMQACWKLIRTARSVSDLQGGVTFEDGAGGRREIKLDTNCLASVTASERRSWIDYVRRMQSELRAIGLGPGDERGILEMLRRDQGLNENDPQDLSRKLDGLNHMLAKFLALSLKTKGAYNPTTEKRKGDAFDIDLLFCLPLPALICTADGKFVDRLRDTNSPEALRVLKVREFNKHVESGTLSTLLQGVRDSGEQRREWHEAAYLRWIERNRAHGQDLEDWFESEPVA